MTPERAEELKRQQYTTMTFDEATELCDSALRLATIEAAGDEEVEKCRTKIEGHIFHLPAWAEIECETALDSIGNMLKSRNATIADLRAKLGEAESLLRDFVRVGDLAAGKLSDHVGEMSRNFSQLSDLEVEQLGVAKRLLKFVSESEVGSE